MKRFSWQVWLGISLLILSALFYLLHYLVFRDAHHIFIYLVGDVAFVFIEVLLVTLIIHHLLEEMAKKSRLNKLNMVIGAFFSEVGNRLLRILSGLDPATAKLRADLSKAGKEPKYQLQAVTRWLDTSPLKLEGGGVDWEGMKEFLVGKRDFLLRLLENGNLLEHESFTDMLWAVFHLTEELAARKSLTGLPEMDYEHLDGDMTRVYGQLARQWRDYMFHLERRYPYLFSLAMRTDPFNPSASAVIRN